MQVKTRVKAGRNRRQPQRDAGAGSTPGTGPEGQDACQSRRRHKPATQRDAGAGHGPGPEPQGQDPRQGRKVIIVNHNETLVRDTPRQRSCA